MQRAACLIGLLFFWMIGAAQSSRDSIEFCGEVVACPAYTAPAFSPTLSTTAIEHFVEGLDTEALKPFVASLRQYKEEHQPDDWLFYQLVRRMAQRLSPKATDYNRYTIYKWWLLIQAGYDSRLAVADNYLLLYVQSDESIYNVPSRTIDARQYVCLNYHDYGNRIDFDKHRFSLVNGLQPQQPKSFSYQVQRLPGFEGSEVAEKEVQFTNGATEYRFTIKLNPQVKALFSNYPVVDYSLQFNLPLSKPTYESLIPSLKKYTAGMNEKEGVEFLMRFTRYAFLFKPDTESYGDEKRLSPEQTLSFEFSDCEDRAALFFCLVKALYNLPMLVLTSPEHVTVAVGFNKGYGKTIQYNGKCYSVCEPSPQRYDLNVGQILPELRKQHYEIAYAYHPPQ